MQARAAAGCATRYLGASPSSSAAETGLFALGDTQALIKWQLIRT